MKGQILIGVQHRQVKGSLGIARNGCLSIPIGRFRGILWNPLTLAMKRGQIEFGSDASSTSGQKQPSRRRRVIMSAAIARNVKICESSISI
jgi:hypothetical protein